MYFFALEELDMSGNPKMLSIPDFVFHVPNLQKLDISMTGVHEFDKNLCQGQNLVILLSKYNIGNKQHIPVTVLCENESESDVEDDTENENKSDLEDDVEVELEKTPE
jgi:Leucine-rich repeat (LRR) protein